MAIDTYATGDDRVQIEFAQNALRTVTSYDVETGIFSQPSTFSASLGDSRSTANLLKQIPPNTAFRILVGGAPQFAGFTEGRQSSGNATSGSELRVHGRSVLCKLLTDIEKEESFNAATHRQLIEKALADYEVFKPFAPAGTHPSVLSSNETYRQQRSKTNVASHGIDDWETVLAQAAGNQGDAYPVLRTKLAEKVLDLLRRHLDTVGLFLWDSPTGDLIVGRPNPYQPATARLFRRLTDRASAGNIERHSWREDYSRRYSEVVIYSKTTGGKYTRHTTHGSMVDQDVIDLGFRRVKVLRDRNVTSVAHATAIARKHIAAGRRDGFHLEYTVRGHSTKNLLTGGSMVWAPDTCVEVIDDALGLEDVYYVEHVAFHRGPDGTTTTLRLLERDTLIFGSDESLAPKAKPTDGAASAGTPKQYFVINDSTLLDLSLILYGDGSHVDDLQARNASLLTFDQVRKQQIIPADTTITYLPLPK